MEVGRLREEGDHNVGGIPGLYLQVIDGSRSWILRFKFGTRRRRMGLGSFPAVPLAQARERAREAHRLLDEGGAPSKRATPLKGLQWHLKLGR